MRRQHRLFLPTVGEARPATPTCVAPPIPQAPADTGQEPLAASISAQAQELLVTLDADLRAKAIRRAMLRPDQLLAAALAEWPDAAWPRRSAPSWAWCGSSSSAAGRGMRAGPMTC